MIASTLPGERHEWGVLSTPASLQERGWRVHLGPDLPLTEVMMAAWKLRPRCVALSASDPHVIVANLAGLSDLPHRLPPGASAVIGGEASPPTAGGSRRAVLGLAPTRRQ